MNAQSKRIYHFVQVKADTEHHLSTTKLKLKDYWAIRNWLHRYQMYIITGVKPKLRVYT